MNTTFFSVTRLACAALCLFMLAGMNAHPADGVLKLEAQLVVGSNDPQTKGAPVSPQIEKKLKRLPLKWGSYYVTSSQQFSLAKDASKQLVLGGSDMVVKNLGGERVELTIINRGKITQSLSKGQTLVTNVKDENSFVVLRQAD
jgi:hypothetical protein